MPCLLFIMSTSIGSCFCIYIETLRQLFFFFNKKKHGTSWRHFPLLIRCSPCEEGTPGKHPPPPPRHVRTHLHLAAEVLRVDARLVVVAPVVPAHVHQLVVKLQQHHHNHQVYHRREDGEDLQHQAGSQLRTHTAEGHETSGRRQRCGPAALPTVMVPWVPASLTVGMCRDLAAMAKIPATTTWGSNARGTTFNVSSGFV